ncbi:MAG: VanZ family protein, partial [Gemmataceae bacterium]
MKPWLPDDLPPPTARTYAFLTLFCLAFIAYGSFVPFQFQSRSWDDALSAWRWVLDHRRLAASRSDWLANVLLGVPVGFCLLGMIHVDRPGKRHRFLSILCLWPCCVLFSIFVEFVQLYLPMRTSSFSDVLAQALGFLIGFFSWFLMGQQITHWLRDLWASPQV